MWDKWKKQCRWKLGTGRDGRDMPTAFGPSVAGVELIWAGQSWADQSSAEQSRVEQSKSNADQIRSEQSNADQSSAEQRRAVNQLEVSYIRILSEIFHLFLSKWRGHGRSSCTNTPVFYPI